LEKVAEKQLDWKTLSKIFALKRIFNLSWISLLIDTFPRYLDKDKKQKKNKDSRELSLSKYLSKGISFSYNHTTKKCIRSKPKKYVSQKPV